MAKSREIEVFGLSFMDLISCALGGMLVLMFVFSTLVNPDGVAKRSKAEAMGKTVAELEREMIFNTHFVLTVSLDNSDIKMEPLNFSDLFTSIGKKNNTHIFMFNATNKVVDKVTFEFSQVSNSGEVNLLGHPSEFIPQGTKYFDVIKEKTTYKIRFRNG